MNWRRGLRRVSAVFWGFVALLALTFIGAIASDRMADQSIAFALGYFAAVGGFALGMVVLAHRGTCWLIDGFLGDPKLPPSAP